MAYTNRPATTWLASTLSGQSSNHWSLADLQRALALLDVGEADVLIVAKLDPLSRSLLDFAGLTAQAQRGGWSIVALDIGVDTSTVNNEPVMLTAETERLISIPRADGKSYRAVAALLNDQGVDTAQGGQQWHGSSVRAVEQHVQAVAAS